MSSLMYWLRSSLMYWFNRIIVIPRNWTLEWVYEVVAPAVAAWFRWIYALIRLLGRQVLQPLVRCLPNLGDTLEELGERYALRAQWFKRGEEVSAFLAPEAEEGVGISAWAAAEFGVGLTTLIGGLVIFAVVLSVVAPAIVAGIDDYYNGVARRAYLLQIQHQIFEGGGAYPGMPPDLGRNWRPGPPEQERLGHLFNLNATPVTSAGTAARDVDDQTTDDWAALIDSKAPPNGTAPRSASAPVFQSLPRHNSGGNYSVQTSDGEPLNEAALQKQRGDALIKGDMAKYNQLVVEHRKLYLQHGVDPCSSGFAVQQLCMQ